MRVKHLMTADVVTVGPETTIAEAAKKMAEKNVGCLVVCSDDKQVKGLIVDRAIVTKVVGEGKDPASIAVKDVMTTNPTTIDSEATVFDACSIISRQGPFRRAPVVENGTCVGILSIADLATAAECLTSTILEEVRSSQKSAKVTHAESQAEIEQAMPH